MGKHRRRIPDHVVMQAWSADHHQPSVPEPPLELNDAAAWQRLCQWLERHAQRHRQTFTTHVPADLRSLLLETRQREALWSELERQQLLPVLIHDRHGWVLRQDWRERIERMREHYLA